MATDLNLSQQRADHQDDEEDPADRNWKENLVTSRNFGLFYVSHRAPLLQSQRPDGW